MWNVEEMVKGESEVSSELPFVEDMLSFLRPQTPSSKLQAPRSRLKPPSPTM